jgi:hypothetical protein
LPPGWQPDRCARISARSSCFEPYLSIRQRSTAVGLGVFDRLVIGVALPMADHPALPDLAIMNAHHCDEQMV